MSTNNEHKCDEGAYCSTEEEIMEARRDIHHRGFQGTRGRYYGPTNIPMPDEREDPD